MARLTPLTERLASLVNDLDERVWCMDAQSGDILLSEREFALICEIVLELVEMADRLSLGRRIGRTVEDAGEITAHAQRLNRELVARYGSVADRTRNRARRAPYPVSSVRNWQEGPTSPAR